MSSVTGYERQAFNDLQRIADNLEQIAAILEAIRWQMVKTNEDRKREHHEGGEL